MASDQELIDAVEDGNRTHAEVGDAVGLHEGQAGRRLRQLVDAGVLYRQKGSGGAYEYHVAQKDLAADTGSPEPAGEPSTGEVADVQVRRDYNWADEVPGDAHRYQPTNGEWDKINAIIDAREDSGLLPRFLISGPSGNGKTTLAEWYARKNEMPYFEVSMSNAIYESNLIGSPRMTADGEVWEDGPLTKALLASQDRPVVLVIDEATRATPEVLNVLFPVLDHRCRVQLPPTAPEDEVAGVPQNLIVFATINEGREYTGAHQDMDHALKRRFKLKFDTDYLGVNHPARERDLVVARTPAHEALAEKLVEAANGVRDVAKDPDPDTQVRKALPTAAILDWAGAAYSYHVAGEADPIDEAARDIVNMYYDGPAADAVETMLLSPVGGAPFDPDEFAAWAGEKGARLTCPSCGWSEYEEDAPDAARDWMDCPECSETLDKRT